MRRTSSTSLAALAVAVAVVVFVFVFRGPVVVFPASQASPAPAGQASKSAAKAAAAPYQLVGIDGIKDLLRKARGHVVLVHFWASWCYPCLKELPLIDRFAREMKPRGLEVLSLSLDNPTSMAARVGVLLQKTAPNLTPNIAQFDDADALIAAIDPRWAGAIPALFVYDHQGQLRGTLVGESSRAELDALVVAPLKAAAAAAPPPSAPSAPPVAGTK